MEQVTTLLKMAVHNIVSSTCTTNKRKNSRYKISVFSFAHRPSGILPLGSKTCFTHERLGDYKC